MSTRAVYTFIDRDGDSYSVYKHCDGYPEGAAAFIGNAKKLAWELPRFEANEFAAAFIAANKESQGDIYLTKSHECHRDLSFRYEIKQLKEDDTDLHVTAYYTYEKKKIFEGSLSSFARYAKTSTG
jgi:hypothetical protein